MSAKNPTILQFFKPAQRHSEAPKVVNNVPSESSALAPFSGDPELAKAFSTSNIAECQSETTDIPPCPIEVQPEPLKATAAFDDAPSPSPPPPTASVMSSLPNKARPSSQRVIKSSDDEDSESGSDDSLVDLADLLQSRSTTYRPQTTTQKTQTPPRSKASRGSSNYLTSPLSLQPKNKYRFGLKALVSQSQKHAATEASAQRVQGILDDKSAGVAAAQEDEREAHSSLLGSVITETDGNGVEKVLQAVRRTEAIQAEKCWYFFDPQGETPRQDPRIFPAECATEPWQKKLVKREDRERCVESGFVKDIVTIEEELPEELFLWILDEVCIESNDNLRRAYCEVLLAAADSIDDYLTPEVVKAMFDNLGALGGSTDLKARVEAVNVCKRAYEKRDWGALKTVIRFLGDSAQFAVPATCNFSIAILARLCADRLVWDNIGLFSAVQKSMSQLSEAIDDDRWEISVRTFFSIPALLLTNDSVSQYMQIHLQHRAAAFSPTPDPALHTRIKRAPTRTPPAARLRRLLRRPQPPLAARATDLRNLETEQDPLPPALHHNAADGLPRPHRRDLPARHRARLRLLLRPPRHVSRLPAGEPASRRPGREGEGVQRRRRRARLPAQGPVEQHLRGRGVVHLAHRREGGDGGSAEPAAVYREDEAGAEGEDF